MKNKNGIALLGIVAFFALVAITATASAQPAENVVWLEPENSSVPGYCNTVGVEVWANITDPDGCAGGTLNITYDPGCANVTDWERNTDDWPLGTWNSSVDGREWITFSSVFNRTGEVLIGTLTIHCISTSLCTTPLIFDEGSSLFAEPPTEWRNGTFTCEVLKPDLNVTKVEVNYDAPGLGGRAIGPEPGAGVHTECNNISAVIENNGVCVLSPFNVTFEVDGTTLCTVRVPFLPGGFNETVYCTCLWYPMAGDAFAINVTVDSNNEIPESDETNNTMWNNGTVVSNGYKGGGWQGPDMNLTNVQCHPQDTINLTYSVGDSYYLSGATNWTEYTANWTASDLPVPENATIEKAWLYVYYTWDKDGVMPGNINLTFNGNPIPLARHYSDRKGFSEYDYPAGMMVYNVTSEFNATGENKAVLTKSDAALEVSMKGMLLMVVYKHPDEPERIICIDEGFDMLYANKLYGVSSEEATTYANFTCCEPVPIEEIGKATLITVAPNAADGDDKNRLSFNNGLWKGIWDHYAGATELGIAETDVLAYLKATDNLANFQSHIPTGETEGDFMEASNAFLILEKGIVERPDLNVTEIELNCGGYLFGNESNKICAKIENNGSGDAGAFNVSFVIDGFSKEARIDGLAAGENTTVCIYDTMSRNAGDSVNVTVTADCNGEVIESDETNNESTMVTMVVNNGYKGKRYTGGDDITTWKAFELHGNLLYSLGDSYYLSSYSYPDWTSYIVNWTASDLPVPDTATIKEARLYVPYTWDKGGVMPDEVSLTFNGNNQALAAHYSDRKGYGSYDYPYGMLAYNVTGDFDTSGNTAVLVNSHPGGDNVSIRGMLLVVVYADERELPQRKLFINEGFDLLYGGASKCTTPEEATAYAPFDAMKIDRSKVDSARLITVAPGAGPNEGDLLFNGRTWNDVWSYSAAAQIGIDERDVTSYLRPTSNEAGFRSSEDYMEASNAFLIVTEKITEAEYLKRITQPVDVSKIRYKFIAVNEEWAAKWDTVLLYGQEDTKYSIEIHLNKAGYVTGVDFERWGFSVTEIPVELAAQSLAKLNQ
ncbi:MAG: DUF3344 domain-containing protein [Methanophagales archaeon]|nr:DUF3344 domain-containing protein [Methanophagales archaeon]